MARFHGGALSDHLRMSVFGTSGIRYVLLANVSLVTVSLVTDLGPVRFHGSGRIVSFIGTLCL
jgi:hypothetical protein